MLAIQKHWRASEYGGVGELVVCCSLLVSDLDYFNHGSAASSFLWCGVEVLRDKPLGVLKRRAMMF